MRVNSPRVSILINNFNYGRFLGEAIRSALGQTYKNTEIIVVDDGSTDNSREIIAKFGDLIIPILKENGGQASALNAGFQASQGEFICLMDSDDVWLPQKVERVIEATVSHPDATLIYHRVQPVSADLKPSGKIIPTSVFVGNSALSIKRCAGWWACPPTSALCFRRTAIQHMKPIPEHEFRICADAFLASVAPSIGPVVGLRDCLAFYRLHGSNNFSNATVVAGTQSSAMIESHLRKYERLLASANQRLAEIGSDIILNLDDHWSYQFQKYRLRAPGHRSMLGLVYKALRFAGEPSPLNRLKMWANVLLRGKVPEGLRLQ